MSEVPLHRDTSLVTNSAPRGPSTRVHMSEFQLTAPLRGCLAHEKRPPRRTLQYDHPYGPVVALGGVLFLMSGVPL